MKFAVSKEVLEKVLSYLGSKPYYEAAPLIQAVQQDASVIREDATSVETEAVAASEQ